TEGVVTTAKEEGTDTVIQYAQDCEGILKDAEASRQRDRDERGHFGRRNEFRRVMTVPFVVLMEVGRKLGIPAADLFSREQSKRIYAELKKSEYKYLRTTQDKNI